MKTATAYLPYKLFPGCLLMKTADEDSNQGKSFKLDKPIKIQGISDLGMSVAHDPDTGNFALFPNMMLDAINNKHDGSLFTSTKPNVLDVNPDGNGRSTDQAFYKIIVDTSLNLEPDQLQIFYN